MQYAISAVIVRRSASGFLTHQIPTFYLNADVQGINNEAHAELIARNIIDPFSEEGDGLHICAVGV